MGHFRLFRRVHIAPGLTVNLAKLGHHSALEYVGRMSHSATPASVRQSACPVPVASTPQSRAGTAARIPLRSSPAHAPLRPSSIPAGKRLDASCWCSWKASESPPWELSAFVDIRERGNRKAPDEVALLLHGSAFLICVRKLSALQLARGMIQYFCHAPEITSGPEYQRMVSIQQRLTPDLERAQGHEIHFAAVESSVINAWENNLTGNAALICIPTAMVRFMGGQ